MAEILKAKSEEFDELIEFLNIVFADAYGNADFLGELPKLYTKGTPLIECNSIIKEEGKIKAAIGNFPLPMKVCGKDVLGYGIGAVSVHMDCRGKGYMKQLMKYNFEEMKNASAAFSVLTGLRQRYGYFGYEYAGAKMTMQLTKTNIYHTFGKDYKPSVTFEQVTKENDQLVEFVYQAYSKNPVHCVRDREQFFTICSSWFHKIYVAKDQNDKMIGYFISTDNGYEIHELYACDTKSFIDMACAWVVSHDFYDIKFTLAPYETDYIRALSEFCEFYSQSQVCMLKIFDFEKMIDAFLSLKASYSTLMDGCAVIGIDGYGSYKVLVEDNKVTVKKTDNNAQINLTYLQAVRFLFGAVNIEYVCNENITPEMKNWFPLPFYFHCLDNV